MPKESLYEPFDIVFKELNECPKKAHEHTFFELVYIVSGTGQQCINKNRFNYRKGHMFMITRFFNTGSVKNTKVERMIEESCSGKKKLL